MKYQNLSFDIFFSNGRTDWIFYKLENVAKKTECTQEAPRLLRIKSHL